MERLEEIELGGGLTMPIEEGVRGEVASVSSTKIVEPESEAEMMRALVMRVRAK